ncbi:tyrosine-type recombinase/integrase [Anaerolentibacter hominis]|uniref:tyrosine-type recombinase/integrase n=1 Tax=Anaerolentibacter hominis TaxID=3079009 RepID=UPI0031B89901
MERNYHDQVTIKNELKLRELQKDLPRFAGEFFRGIEPTTSSRTRIAYAYDLIVFFNYLKQNNPSLKNTEVQDLKVSVLDQIKAIDIEEYLAYLNYYQKDGREHINDECGKKRKLIALRSFYNYFYKKERITTNPVALVDIPKLHQKEIVRLDVDEVAELLDQVESGENLTERQKAYHEKTKARDLALMTLLLGTGIRVSECVGLDLNDVDFKNNGIKIRRKGGSETIVYFGDEAADALKQYMDQRRKIAAKSGHENALFLSMQNTRLTVKAVENLVKKYSRLVTTVKKITPHKLRSTYGTNLYRETGDIYLVADVLGHKDVNTTRKHYAAIEDSRRRSAANVVRLRKEK